jgi:hypothetical protein
MGIKGEDPEETRGGETIKEEERWGREKGPTVYKKEREKDDREDRGKVKRSQQCRWVDLGKSNTWSVVCTRRGRTFTIRS